MYIRCTDRRNLFKNLDSLIMKIRWTYILWKFKGKLCTLDVQIFKICWKIRIHWVCKIVKIQMKIEEHTKLSKLNEKVITLIYRSSKFVSKFEVVKCTKSWKFNLKLCTNVLIILIWWKFQNCWTYQIVKIQWKIMYIRCSNILDLLRNLISLKVQNRENSRENCVH